MKRLTIGLILPFLMMLGACSTTPPIVRTVTLHKIKTVLAPSEMIGNCRLPKVSKQGDNSDLLQLNQFSLCRNKKM